jgi:hypothetical protein
MAESEKEAQEKARKAEEELKKVEEKTPRGEMTVQEAGHYGGEIGGHKGGEATLEKHGPEFYSEIGHKGGQKVKRLIEKGEEEEKK